MEIFSKLKGHAKERWQAPVGSSTSTLAPSEITEQTTTAPLKIEPSGLTILPSQDESMPSVDVCFVHGLNGSPQRTWTHEKTRFYWPLQLARDQPTCRVMVFGYNTLIEPSRGSNQIRLPSIASKLLEELVNDRLEDAEVHRPLIFVGHSLGGLIVKKALIECDRNPRHGRGELLSSTQSILFFGTPNAGSNVDKRKRVKILKAIAKAAFTEVPPKIDSLLQSNSDELLDLANQFREISPCRAGELLIYSYYETHEFPGLGERVVDEYSARVMASDERSLPIEADHNGMVKFAGITDSNFVSVSKTVQKLLKMTKRVPSFPAESTSTEVLLKRSRTFDAHANPILTLPQRVAVPNTSSLTDERIYTVPSQQLKVRSFVSRQSLLSRIDSYYKELFEGSSSAPSILSLVGMGGIGKTQIALEYSQLAFHRENSVFHDVIWLNATSGETLTSGVVQLLPKEVSGEEVIGAFQKAMLDLRTRPQPFLMVFDNFDDPAFENILDFIPNSKHCAVLITSRLWEAGQELGEMIDVPLMEDVEALQIVLNRLRIPSIPEQELENASKFLKLLGNLPLALDQAGAFLSSGRARMSFTTFMDQYEARKKDVLNKVPKFWKYKSATEADYDLSVFTTWELSLEKLGRDPEDHRKKVHFLTLTAFLDPHRISRILFHSHSNHLKQCPTCRNPAKSWMSIMSSQDHRFDAFAYRTVVTEMANLSLIQAVTEDASTDTMTISLHPLVREWIRLRMDDHEPRFFALEATLVLHDLHADHRGELGLTEIPRMYSPRTILEGSAWAELFRAMSTELVSHLDICLADWNKFEIGVAAIAVHAMTDPGVIEFDLAIFLIAIEQSKKSLAIMTRLKLYFQQFQDDSSIGALKTVDSIIFTVECIQGGHRGLQALEEMHQRICESHESEPEEELWTKIQLAERYLAVGDYDRSIDLALLSLAKLTSVSGILDDPTDGVLAVRTIAVLVRTGRLQDAFPLIEASIPRLKARLDIGDKVQNTLETLQALTVQFKLLRYQQTGDRSWLDGAEDYWNSMNERPLAPGPRQLERMSLHAGISAAFGRFDQAIQESRPEFLYLKNALGFSSDTVRATAIRFVEFLFQAGNSNISEATQTLDDIDNECVTKLGPSDPIAQEVNRQASAILLDAASHQLHANQYEAAIPIYESYLKIKERTAVECHPDLSSAQESLALCYIKRPHRSIDDLKRAITLYCRLCHASWDESEQNLQHNSLPDSKRGDYDGVVSLVRQSLESRLQSFVKTSIEVAHAHRLLGYVLSLAGQGQDALKHGRAALKISKKLADNGYVYDAIALAKTLERMGDLDTQAGVLVHCLDWVRQTEEKRSGEEIDLLSLLALNAQKLGRHGDTIRYRQEEFELCQTLYGVDHKLTLRSSSTLIESYLNIGN